MPHRSPLARPTSSISLPLLCLAVLAGCADGNGPEVPEPRTVLVATVSTQADAGARFTGQLRATDRSGLAFSAGGAITSLTVDLGDRFNRGDVLGTVEDRQARLDLAARRARLAEAEAALSDARLEYRRRSSLADSGAVSQSAIDQARARFNGAEATVAALRAEVANAEERLADTRLVAPFDGEVVARLAEPAEVIASGRVVLQVIGDPSVLEAIVNVPGRVREDLEREQHALVRVPMRGVEVAGRITEIGAEANGAGLFPITIGSLEREPGLRPGESVEARFRADAAEPRVVIPLAAYVPQGGSTATVFLVEQGDSGEVVRARSVTLGSLRDDGVEVVEGLSPGARIVVRGADLLNDGESVRAVGDGIARYNH